MATDPYCVFCRGIDEEETAMHILKDCITKIRQETFGHHKIDLNTYQQNTNTANTIKSIIKYFKRTKAFSTKREFKI